MPLNQFKIDSRERKPALSSSSKSGGPSAMSMMSMINSNQNAQARLEQAQQPKPLPSRLTDTEQQIVGTVRGLEPSLTRIKDLLGKGIMNSKFGSLGRTMKQQLVDSGDPLLTSTDKDLQDLQSEFNALKADIPFTKGGKALTGIEQKLVFRGLNTRGKSDEIILRDLDRAMGILRNKETIILGGRPAAEAMQSGQGFGGAQPQTQDSGSARQRILDRLRNRGA